MGIYVLIGYVVTATLISLGIAWLMQNVSIKFSKEPYEYKVDSEGNEYVKDNTDE